MRTAVYASGFFSGNTLFRAITSSFMSRHSWTDSKCVAFFAKEVRKKRIYVWYVSYVNQERKKNDVVASVVARFAKL